ncbi:cell migration-inducing and hyaluronan-binding protein-like [Mytilus californianus]|uniref:cell migration-inducing and hyaluronan-binding protein-like n=1 Tax=Mytilus californianus TaxID=6549 RepID=UPI0022484517|nr:cell migration-inducing and hyaluronan-binding protein-like [Mytilus californianus]
MELLKFLFCFVLTAVCAAHCPESDANLLKWSDHAGTWSGSPPAENDNLTITQPILLDEQPPTLYSIVITATGKLVWDPNTVVHLKVHWVQVDGELHIGSEDCPFLSNTHITFLGNVEENNLGAGGDKALFVTAGGSLEIHGKPKLSWTKLAQTAPKFNTETDVIASQQENTNSKGLAVYSINPTTGELVDSAFFNFAINRRKYPALILSFVNFLEGIPNGNVVGIAIHKELPRRDDISGALEAIEILAGQTDGTNPLRDTRDAMYALLTTKGDTVVIASTDYDWKQSEDKTLIECPSCSDNQIRLSGPLKFTHYGEIYKNVDMRGEVGLLTRNILFDSEDAEGSTTYGGNLKALKGFKSVHIENAEFNDLGQQEVLGRYPIHFHMCEDVDEDEATRPWIKHNSIHHSNSRCVTVHGTHGLIVEDNVCYMTKGHGYFLEDGGEKRTVLNGNLGLGQEKGTLIKADISPTTFWITNPLSYVTNNVAAGGDGRGYWYTYPRIPLGPSADKGYMLKDEARHTVISEFDNNVAHSNKQHGFFIDNEFQPDGSASGYNRYRPKEDPIMHLKYKNSTDKPSIINRMTAYKNSPRNAWIRGGMFKIVHASLSDSAELLNIVKENSALQFIDQSVFIGDSPNLGEPATVNGQPISTGRSFPLISANMMESFNPRKGIALRRGPIYVTDVFLDGFADNEYYQMGAISWDKMQGQSPFHSITNAQFGFSDPSEGNRVKGILLDETQRTGDDIRTFRDMDNSMIDLDVSDDSLVTVLSPEAFHMTDECNIRSNWNFGYCEHAYGKLAIKYPSDNVLTMTRDDDYETARVDADSPGDASFLVITGESYSYSMYFEEEVPKEFGILMVGVSKSQGVRLGVCIPFDATFRVFGGMVKWAAVDSLSDVDAIGDYFYDSDTGYLAVFLSDSRDFEPGEVGECVGEGEMCRRVMIKIENGDLTQTDCLSAAHEKFNLSSSSSESRRRLTTLLELLSKRLNHGSRQKRAVDTAGVIDTRELPATANEPPANWGAGSTRG